MPEPEQTRARKASPAEKSWLEYLQTAEQESPNRLEDAAKFLATMISITLSLLLALGKSVFEQPQLPAILWAGLGALFLALFLAFDVLFPRKYSAYHGSANDIRQMHEKIVRIKHRLLLGSVIVYSIALVLLAFGILLQ